MVLVYIVKGIIVDKRFTHGCGDVVLANLSSLGGVGVPFSLLEMLLFGLLLCCPFSLWWGKVPVAICILCLEDRDVLIRESRIKIKILGVVYVLKRFIREMGVLLNNVTTVGLKKTAIYGVLAHSISSRSEPSVFPGRGFSPIICSMTGRLKRASLAFSVNLGLYAEHN